MQFYRSEDFSLLFLHIFDSLIYQVIQIKATTPSRLCDSIHRHKQQEYQATNRDTRTYSMKFALPFSILLAVTSAAPLWKDANGKIVDLNCAGNNATNATTNTTTTLTRPRIHIPSRRADGNDDMQASASAKGPTFAQPGPPWCFRDGPDGGDGCPNGAEQVWSVRCTVLNLPVSPCSVLIQSPGRERLIVSCLLMTT